MSMLRSLVTKVRPGLASVPVRTIRAIPEYSHPADPDPDEEQRFNEQFGLAEPVKDITGLSKHEGWVWIFDPFFKAKTLVGQILCKVVIIHIITLISALCYLNYNMRLDCLCNDFLTSITVKCLKPQICI